MSTFGLFPKVAKESGKTSLSFGKSPKVALGEFGRGGRRGGGSSGGRQSAGMAGSVTGPGCCGPRPTLPATRSELAASALPLGLVPGKGHRGYSVRGNWKPRGFVRVLVSGIGHRGHSVRGNWKPRGFVRVLVSGIGHRGYSVRGNWKPRGFVRVLVSEIGCRGLSGRDDWKPKGMRRRRDGELDVAGGERLCEDCNIAGLGRRGYFLRMMERPSRMGRMTTSTRGSFRIRSLKARSPWVCLSQETFSS